MTNWTRIINFLIGITGPIAALVVVNDHQNVFAAVLVLVAILLIIARASEYQHGAILVDAFERFTSNDSANAESVFLEGYYVVVTPGRKDDNLYAVIKPGHGAPLARGRTYVEAINKAIEAIASN